MKNKKPLDSFYLKPSNKEVYSLYNKDFPISLMFNHDLVNRVCLRYPSIKKTEVIHIILKIFEGLRELMFLGKTVNLTHVFLGFKLFFYQHSYRGDIWHAAKAKINTPIELKND